MVKDKPNFLTLETRRAIMADSAAEKRGTKLRGKERSSAWVAWKAAILGCLPDKVEVPAHAQPVEDAMAWHALHQHRGIGKANHLTNATNRIWTAACNAEKRGDWDRALKRSEEWARWRASQLGLNIPTGAKFAVTQTHANFEMVGPKRYENVGTRRRERWITLPGERTVVASVPLPQHAQPTRDAASWQEEQQRSLVSAWQGQDQPERMAA